MISITWFYALYYVDHIDGILWQDFESIFYKTPLGEKITQHLPTNEDSQLSLLYLRDFILMKIDTQTQDQCEVCMYRFITYVTLYTLLRVSIFFTIKPPIREHFWDYWKVFLIWRCSLIRGLPFRSLSETSWDVWMFVCTGCVKCTATNFKASYNKINCIYSMTT